MNIEIYLSWSLTEANKHYIIYTQHQMPDHMGAYLNIYIVDILTFYMFQR